MRLRLVLALSVALVVVPGAATALPVASESTRIPAGIGESGDHLVCWAPEFSDWTLCVNHP